MSQLPPDTIVTVVLQKDISYANYLEMISAVRAKGWRIQAYQKGWEYSTSSKKTPETNSNN
ncbi:hypothetical protein [Tenacibaculum maritimum]|uniref:hypothetical protein n=1 Tax=Tenacibaculum maritimum TaxID=107401 RepID=UPI0012E55412|nr:hypothetical protein [Tenacibaculum maritimum]CAA0157756.1 hypothetical protein JIP4600_100068 [Tenacibaculum maritimum]CAA0170994.1 hypothetical protein TMFC_140052 [Tenacibaculum maritimum]CAA0206636.1 hypothetical protein TMP139_310055 [Tenacibaculum maritimum]